MGQGCTSRDEGNDWSVRMERIMDDGVNRAKTNLLTLREDDNPNKVKRIG